MTDYTSISQLLNIQREEDAPVAFQNGQQKSWKQWRSRVEQWRLVLQNHPGKTWALYNDDAYEFSAALFGLWSCQKIACVPGSNQPLVVRSLQQRVDGFIGDFDNVNRLTIPALVSDMASEMVSGFVSGSGELERLELDPQSLALEVFTSGSSGEPEAIPKQLYQLSAEVDNLQKLWGDSLRDAVVAATVSHHHIYGLLFRVLWPLAAGKSFEAQLCDVLEDVVPRTKAEKKFILISSPTHLSRIPDQNKWSDFAEKCNAIFSSGAPLPQVASVSATTLLGTTPIEVFGSSETGGIAWRQQSAATEVLWQPVPGVQVSLDTESDCLQIHSPYLPAPFNTQDENAPWYVTSDKVKITSHELFQLLGRADRIAKIEGKRVSIVEMESRLLEHGYVDAVRLVELTGHRSELGAVIQLSEVGRDAERQLTKRQMNLSLQNFLMTQFERAVLPRRWRFLRELPYNNQGKITQQSLKMLFQKNEVIKFPQVVNSRQDGEQWILTLLVPEGLLYFEGHFPVAPILPGVVQIHWAEHYGRTLLGFEGKFSHLEVIKFQHVISPNRELKLSLKLDVENNKLYFSYQSDSGQHSSGRIVKNKNTVEGCNA